MKNELKKSILAQVGISKKEFKKDVRDYQNAQNGISGFIYYSQTHKFAIENQNEIIELLEEQAEGIGLEVFEMVASFGVFKNGIEKEEKKDIYRFLGGNTNIEEYESFSVLNVMAWFAVETLAFELDN